MQSRLAAAVLPGDVPQSPAPADAWPRGRRMASAIDVPRLSPLALALVVLAHLGLLALLASMRVAFAPSLPTAVMVEVIRSMPAAQKVPDIIPPKPATTLPRPKPVQRKVRPQPAVQAPVLAAESLDRIPAEEVVRPAEPAPLPPAQAQAPAPVLRTAPRFDADYLDNPIPTYPPLSRREGEEGRVVLRVFVEPSGLPGRIEVRTSSGFERLDRSAAAAVRRWKFVPARQGDEAVGAWVLVPIVFSLKV